MKLTNEIQEILNQPISGKKSRLTRKNSNCNVSTLDVHPRGLFYNNSFSVVSRRVLDESDMMHITCSFIY